MNTNKRVEIDNPKTVYEKINAAANLVEQMALAKTVGDDQHFNKTKAKAAKTSF
jgi:hypothetical protein